MELQFRCPSCDKLLQVPSRLAGKKVRCTKCEKVVTAPDEDEPKHAVTSRSSGRRPPSDVDERDDRDDRDDDRESRSSRRRRPDYDDRDRPSRRKSGAGLWIALAAGGLGAVALASGVIFALTRDSGPPPIVKPKVVVVEAPKEEAPQQPIINFPQPGQGNAPAVIMTPQGPIIVGGQQQAAPGQLGPQALSSVKNATAFLRVTFADGQVGEGSGFLAVEDNMVLTNAHVVGMRTPNSKPPRDILVVLHSGEPNEQKYPGTLMGAHWDLDLAAVKIEAAGAPLPPRLRIGAAMFLRELQDVFIFGFPFGAQLGKDITVTNSKVSSLRKFPNGVIARIQVNGGMNPGNSGGPVVDANGTVIGVAVAGIPGTQINFAIPAEHIGVLMQGSVRNTEIGAAYRDGATVKLPIRVACTDPLHRIRDCQIDVWTGKDGPARQGTALFAPLAQPNDGPRTTVPLTYRDGLAEADIELPALADGQALWLQPVVTGTQGGKQWAMATAFHPIDEAPLERQPATFRLSNTEVAERTLCYQAARQVRLIKGPGQVVFGERVDVNLLEHLQTEPRGVNVNLHPGTVRVRRELGGKPYESGSQGPYLIQRMVFSFLMSPDGLLKERGQPAEIKALPAALRKDAEISFNLVANCYEATSLLVPLKKVDALETWDARLPLLVVADNKDEVVDLKLKCTYEGLRKQAGNDVAYVKIGGDVVTRTPKSPAAGKVNGHILFDLARGFICQAKLVIESEVGAGASVATNTLELRLTREAGNTQRIAKLDPKAKLPTNPADLKVPVTPIAKGKELLKVEETLTANDPVDKHQPGGHFKEHKIRLDAGVTYVIEMNTTDGKKLDPLLRLETAQGRVVAFDDDSGGDLNARIVYTPVHSAEYRIIATVFDTQQTGPYTLIVSEAGKETMPPAKTGKK